MDTSFLNKRFLTVRVGDILAFLGFYIFFSLFYYVTLYINRQGYSEREDKFFDFWIVIDDSGLDYMIKLILTLPIWYLLFRKLKHWTMTKRLLLHVILLPIFVIVWQQLYYEICEAIGFFHLGGTGRIWDIYIPALFYILQFGIMHSYNFYLENRRKLILEGELRHAALKSELSALKAQLNPHFLYNTFNTISASVPPKNEKTRYLIAELSDLFRYQLKASQVDKVTLKEELDFVNKYLALEKERFQERLNIEMDVAETLYEELIPPMLLQPLVENSIKHGLSSLIEGGKISIKIIKKDEKLHFEIADTGIGIENKDSVFHKGIGLTNTRLRLEKIYKSTLKLSDNTPQGLKISFTI